MLIALPGPPDLSGDKLEAKVCFFASDAPHEVIEPGADFELFCGEVHYAHGRIKQLLPDEPGC